jgi:general secretion pathway protein D
MKKAVVSFVALASFVFAAHSQPGPAESQVLGLPQSGFGAPPTVPTTGPHYPVAGMQPQWPAYSMPATPVSSGHRVPKGPTQLIDLPRLDNRAIGEVIAALVTRFQIEHGYTSGNSADEKLLPVPSQVVAAGPVLKRVDVHGRKSMLLRFGFVRQTGQLPQLWASGMLGPDATVANPDGALVEPALDTILASREKSESELAMTDLRSQVINLAYVDAEGAIGMLRAMGFNVTGVDRAPQPGWGSTYGTGYGSTYGPTYGTSPGQGTYPQASYSPGAGMPWGWSQGNGVPGAGAINSVASPPRKIRNSDLPLVIRMPGPNPQDVGLVGATSDGSAAAPSAGQNGATTILGPTTRLSTETLASPTTQLLVLYNPDRPEQLARVRRALSESIDTPARQIVIEAMVLEVTSSGLRELGVEWNYQKGYNSLSLGSLTAGTANNTLTFSRNTAMQQLVKAFFAKVQALVQTGKAEVLARPSVLTLDNRQATIRVGTDIPIATSRDTSSGLDARVSYSFFYLPTGIQLNVRPRIDNDGNEVSLQIDAAVSATVANLGAQIRSPGDVVLAAAPAVSTRRVQTYARIPNSTPLIIGGLISRTRDDVDNSTPILGEIPVIGALFGAKNATQSRDEVIIVLTPYVLAKGRSELEDAMPSDKATFEYSRENELFRKSLRLRSDDLLNTAYIRENARLVRVRGLVNRIAQADPSQVENTPLAAVSGQRTPGEETLVAGMLYQVVKRHYDGEQVSPDHMLLIRERDQGEVKLRSVGRLLAEGGDGTNWASFFSRNPGKCMAITFTSHRQAYAPGNVLEDPEPRTRVVDCKPDRSDWATLLYELNRNTAHDNVNTILLHDESDLRSLSNAITLKRLIQINGGTSALNLEQMGIGRVLGLPEFGKNQDHLMQSDVARYFYLSQHYYKAFEEDFEDGMSTIDKLLRSGKYNDLISAEELPPGASPLAKP